MPRKFNLNWDEINKCWFKYYQDTTTGHRKKKYLKRAKSKTNDPISYEIALKLWALFKMNEFQSFEKEKRKLEKASKNKTKFKTGSISYHADQYINIHTARQYKRDQITLHSVKLRKQTMKWLERFLGQSVINKGKEEGGGLDNIMTAQKMMYMKEYFTSEFSLRKNISYATARTHFGGIKQFIKWAFESNKMKTHPRNLYSRLLHLKKPKIRGNDVSIVTTKFKIFTDSQISKIIDHSAKFNSNHFAALYVLLALNTGMSIIDIGTLRWGHLHFDPVDLRNPIRITKARSKTESGFFGTLPRDV